MKGGGGLTRIKTNSRRSGSRFKKTKSGKVSGTGGGMNDLRTKRYLLFEWPQTCLDRKNKSFFSGEGNGNVKKVWEVL